MKPIIASLLILLSATPNGAQTNFKEGEGNWRFGLSLGSKLHRIDDIKTTMIREFYDQSTYSAESQYRLGVVGGANIWHGIPGGKVSIQVEVSYSQPWEGKGESFDDFEKLNDFVYEDNRNLRYRVQFNFSYLDLFLLTRFNIIDNLAIGVGPHVGLVLNGNKIEYRSLEENTGFDDFELHLRDLQIQQNLRTAIKAQSAISMVGSILFDIPLGDLEGRKIGLEARYYLGLSDVLETLANGYDFIENQNKRRHTFELRLNYFIPFPS